MRSNYTRSALKSTALGEAVSHRLVEEEMRLGLRPL